jgi:hypothetical protein
VPGFGYGPFGSENFGEWKWSKQALYDFIPEVYRIEDVQNNKFLEKFSDSIRPSFDDLRVKMRDFLDLRDPFKVRTQYDSTTGITLGKKVEQKGTVLQSGVGASVDGRAQFVAPTGRFNNSSVGKTITITKSTNPLNNRDVTVAAVVNSTTVLTSPQLAFPDSSLKWEMRLQYPTSQTKVELEIRAANNLDLIVPGWFLQDGYSEFEVSSRRRFFADSGLPYAPFVQMGTGLTLLTSTKIRASGLALVQADVGKTLLLRGAVLAQNNGVFRIRDVQAAADEAILEATFEVTDLANGSMEWALLANPVLGHIELKGASIPKGIIEQEGRDAIVSVIDSTTVQVQAASGSFTIADADSLNPKTVTLLGAYRTGHPSTDNSITGTVKSVVNPTTIWIQKDPTVTVTSESGLLWELRTVTTDALGQNKNAVRAPSLLSYLAQDFGIDVDTQESEERQRTWVYQVSQWINKKGLQKAYQILGAISGYSVTAYQLFRVTQEIYSLIPPVYRLSYGEDEAGSYGLDGTLSLVTTERVRFYSPTAVFGEDIVGRQIRIEGAGNVINNRLNTVVARVDEHTVDFRPDVDVGALPEPNNGRLEWRVTRLYSMLPPLLPKFDEFSSDFMEQLMDGLPPTTTHFSVDKFAWEADFQAEVNLTIVASAFTAPGVVQVETTDGSPLRAGLPNGSAAVIQSLGYWKLIDSMGEVYYVESIPVAITPSPHYIFNVASTSLPNTGAAKLYYISPVQSNSDYYPSYKMLVVLEAGLTAQLTIG